MKHQTRKFQLVNVVSDLCHNDIETASPLQHDWKMVEIGAPRILLLDRTSHSILLVVKGRSNSKIAQ